MPHARTGPSLTLLLACAVPVVVALALLPRVIDLYQTELLIYGLTFAIAALGFNLLLGYTGLLSFGHSAYFGIGAYTVAFIVRDLGVHSMELCILGGLAGTLLICGAVRLRVRAPHAHLLRHPDAGPVPGAVEPRLQVLLGDRRHRRHPRAARQAHAARPACSTSRAPARTQRFVYAYYYYVLVLFADRRGGHVGDRALAVRQGAAGDPRQRDPRRLRRHAGAALPLDRLRHLRPVHGPCRHPVGAAQRPHHAGHPLLAVLRRDRVHDRARRLPHLHRARSSARSPSTTSRSTRWRARNTGSWCWASCWWSW